MNNEPVAWMLKTKNGLAAIVWNEEDLEKEKQLFKDWEWDCEVVSLYTHPAGITDEEIGEIWKDCMESPYMQVSNPVGFAREILRKAQEK